MNKKISDIASNLYYDNKLLTGDAVKNQKISLKNNKYFLLNEDVITFIDISDVNFNEVDSAVGCCNKYESCSVVLIIISQPLLIRHAIFTIFSSSVY